MGKKKISETEAAGIFVASMGKGVQEAWPSIVSELAPLLGNDVQQMDTEQGMFDFVLAVIAAQMQALANLLPADQVPRVREYILKCISSPELGTYPIDSLKEYEHAWKASLDAGEPPWDGLASILYDKIGCDKRISIGDVKLKSPLLLIGLGSAIVRFGGAWWKNFLSRHELAPNI